MAYTENDNPGLPQEKLWSSLQARADTLDVAGAAISAFNLYGSAHECLDPWRVDLMESDYFSYELAELLLFAHRNDIARIYFYKLLDFDSQASKLGFFTPEGEPKRAYEQVARVWAVIQDGCRAYELESPRRIRVVGENERVFEAALGPIEAPGRFLGVSWAFGECELRSVYRMAKEGLMGFARKRMVVRARDRVRLLVVEDDDFYARLVSDLLNAAPALLPDITRTSKLAETLECLERDEYDVVVLD